MFKIICVFSSQYQSFDWISLDAVIVALAAGFAAWYTSYTNNRLNRASIMLHLYELEEKNNARFLKYRKGLNAINEWIENKNGHFTSSEFYEEFSRKKYKELRQVLYFYEYLGSIVRTHQVSFNQVFSVIYFPDELSQQAQRLQAKVALVKPDFLENYIYLYQRYKKMRIKKKV